MAFLWGKTWSKFSSFVLFLFSNIFFSLQGEWDFSKKWRKGRRQKLPFFWVKTWSNYVAQHAWTKFWPILGPSLDSSCLTLFGLFSFPKYVETTILGAFQQTSAFFKPAPPPKKIGTLFVNTTALTDKKKKTFSVFFVSAFLFFFCVFVVSGFLRGMEKQKKTKLKTKQPKRKEDHRMQTTEPLSPVFKKQKTQTQII